MYEKRIGGEVVKLLTAEELYGILNQPEDEGSFVLDLKVAREERAEQILKSNWMKKWVREQKTAHEAGESKGSVLVLWKEDLNG